MVLMPNTAKGGGISRKFSINDRQKIWKFNKIEIPKSMGVIVRTGANKTKNEIEKDFQNTLKTWEEIKDKAVISNAPSLIYEEGDIIKRASEIFTITKLNLFMLMVRRDTKRPRSL